METEWLERRELNKVNSKDSTPIAYHQMVKGPKVMLVGRSMSPRAS